MMMMMMMMMMIFSTTQQHHQLEANLPKLSVNVSSSITQFPSATLQVRPEKKQIPASSYSQPIITSKKTKTASQMISLPHARFSRALLTSSAHIFFKPNQSFTLAIFFWNLDKCGGERGSTATFRSWVLLLQRLSELSLSQNTHTHTHTHIISSGAQYVILHSTNG
jgi:hypothetical protein